MPEKIPSKTSKSDVSRLLEETKQLPPQTAREIRRGVTVRRTSGGIPVVRLHYSAHPERDPDQHPEWKQQERRLYTSQASWDREQEIRDEAGGGELVFADTLITHWNKIVITNPAWRPQPTWKIEGGMDYGKTNPTVLERTYIDHDGVIIFAGEYYVPGLEVWQHARDMKEMPDFFKMDPCYADPSIFTANMEQSAADGRKPQERAKSIAELYDEQGVQIFSRFAGDRSDVSFAERLAMHWADLEHRDPTVKIVCRNYSERPQYGLHPWDCPNLLWELMRARRVKLTAQQLLSRNASEALVDKENHARDCCKYNLLSHPEPATKPYGMRVEERLAKMWEKDPVQAMMQVEAIRREEQQKDQASTYIGGNIRHRLADEAAKGRR
jgi:hypothetical protein